MSSRSLISALVPRRMVHNRSENVILADALNLLSPTEPTPAEGFKPSLMATFAKGPASEQFKADDIMSVKYKHGSYENTAKMYVNNLLVGLHSSNIIDSSTPNFQVLQMSPKELANYIKSVTNENRLFELMELFYYQNRLTPRILTDIVLNKHLKNLGSSTRASPCPFNLAELRNLNLNLNWTPINYVQFDIILLKKYHDLKKPLLIIKNLKENAQNNYFPLIESQKLSPFYERIIWKFAFDYIKDFDEIHYMRKLNSLRSSTLIWESSVHNNHKISQYISGTEGLGEIQRHFFALCNSRQIQAKINQELEQNPQYSSTLSELKKISIKHKIYELGDSPTKQTRMAYYSLLSVLETVAKKYGAHEVTTQLSSFREQVLMKLPQDGELKWLDEFLELGRT